MVANHFYETRKDDALSAFSINGIEIDLKELEELERRVAAKKQQQAQSTSNNISNNDREDSSEKLHDIFEKSLNISGQSNAAVSVQTPVTANSHCSSLASMFLVIMSIFSVMNQIYYMPTAQRS